jgi:hypothetical protein
MQAAQRTDIELRKKAEKRAQELSDIQDAMLADIHAAWLALADSDIDEADRLLVKWVNVYRDRPTPAEG